MKNKIFKTKILQLIKKIKKINFFNILRRKGQKKELMMHLAFFLSRIEQFSINLNYFTSLVYIKYDVLHFLQKNHIIP